MKSSTGYYNSRLDHVRALAAFLVCYWHAVHGTVSTEYVPSFFALSLFEEGYTGVSLFMTLSGFLFARIIGNQAISFSAFAWNRFLRLAPLLVVVFTIYLVLGQTTPSNLLRGLVFPVWPGVTWSITAELHFYLVFPFLLLLVHRLGPVSILPLIGVALLTRAILWNLYGEVQALAYWTFVGRADQFLWGAFFGFSISARGIAAVGGKGANLIAAVTALSFLLAWHGFNLIGGFYHIGGYPSPSALWIVLPSVEGVAYAILIAWYSEASLKLPKGLDRIIAIIGTVSFSIYLWHVQLIGPIYQLFDALHLSRTNYLSASVLAIGYFMLVAIISCFSYWLVEKPFLSLRTRYVIKDVPAVGQTAAASALVQRDT